MLHVLTLRYDTICIMSKTKGTNTVGERGLLPLTDRLSGFTQQRPVEHPFGRYFGLRGILVRRGILGFSLASIGFFMYVYRVIQEESAILWEMIVCVILRKKVHIHMGPILSGYRDMVKKKIRTILRARTAIT